MGKFIHIVYPSINHQPIAIVIIIMQDEFRYVQSVLVGIKMRTFIGGEYYWVPFNQIQRMDFEAPQDLRDLVWAPCSFTWVNHGEVVGLVPCRYDPLAASDTNETDLLLSRQTHWQAHGEDEYSGFGQRMFTTDQDELSLLDIRSVTFNQ